MREVESIFVILHRCYVKQGLKNRKKCVFEKRFVQILIVIFTIVRGAVEVACENEETG